MSHSITGTVKDPSNQPLEGVTVRISNPDSSYPDYSYTTTTNASGDYAFYLYSSTVNWIFSYNGTTRAWISMRFEVLDSLERVIATEDVVITWEQICWGVTVDLTATPVVDDDQDNCCCHCCDDDDGDAPCEFRVTGWLRKPTGEPLGGHIVRLLERGLRSETSLESVNVDAEGNFELVWDPEGRCADRKLQLDVQIAAYSATDVEIARSELWCKPELTVEAFLVEDNEPYLGPTSFAEIKAVVEPLLDGVSWTDLSNEDVVTLACKLDRDEQDVRELVDAYRLADDATELHAAWASGGDAPDLPDADALLQAMYALMHSGRAALLNSLTSIDHEELVEALTDAEEQRWVSPWVPADDDQPGEAVELSTFLRSLAAGALLKGNSVTILRDVLNDEVLGLSPADATIYEQLVHQYFQATNPADGSSPVDDDIWQYVKDQLPTEYADLVDTVQFGLSAALVASRHIPMVGYIMRLRKDPSDPLSDGVETFRELAVRTPEDWRASIDETIVLDEIHDGVIGAPDYFSGADEEATKVAYALSISRMFEELHPTVATLGRLVAYPDLGDIDAQAVLDFSLRYPSFSLETTVVDDMTGLSADDQDNAALLEQVKRVQRLAGLAPPYERDRAMSVLAAAGIHTGQQIVHMGRSNFLRDFAEDLGGVDLAALTYERASEVTSAAVATLVEYMPALYGGGPKLGLPQDSGSDVPTLNSLLGSLDYCECRHCRSVLSPAAYFVDLLQVLAELPGGPAGSALNAFLQRRPDVQHIELNCTNTHRPMPHIDLVNELLESKLAEFHGLPVEHARQTTWSASRLQGDPEHLRTDVYEKVAEPEFAKFPWTLPFNLLWEEIGIYLAVLGIDRTTLASLALPAVALLDDSERRQLTQARLELGPGLYDILANQDPDLDTWGLGVGSPELLKNAVRVRDKSGLAVAQVLDIFETDYVGAPAGAIGFEYVDDDGQPEDPCQLENLRYLQLGSLTAGPGAERMTRFQKFYRLRELLGWKNAELDYALKVLGGVASTDALGTEVLFRLGQARTMLGRLPALNRTEALALLGDLEALDRRDFGGDRGTLLGVDDPSFQDSDGEAFPIKETLYSRRFLRRSEDPALAGFVLETREPGDASDAAVAAPVPISAANAHVIASACRVSKEDVRLLTLELHRRHADGANTGRPLSALSGIPTDVSDEVWPIGVETSLENLSEIYHMATMGRATGLQTKGWLTLQRIANIWSRADGVSERAQLANETLDWVDLIEQVGIPLEALEYGLRGVATPGSQLALPPAEGATQLLSILPTIQSIQLEHSLEAAGLVGYAEMAARALTLSGEFTEFDVETAVAAVGHTLEGDAATQAAEIEHSRIFVFIRLFDDDTATRFAERAGDETLSEGQIFAEVQSFAAAAIAFAEQQLGGGPAIARLRLAEERRGEGERSALAEIESRLALAFEAQLAQSAVDMLRHALTDGAETLTTQVDRLLNEVYSKFITDEDRLTALRDFALASPVDDQAIEDQALALLPDCVLYVQRRLLRNKISQQLGAALGIEENILAALLDTAELTVEGVTQSGYEWLVDPAFTDLIKIADIEKLVADPEGLAAFVLDSEGQRSPQFRIVRRMHRAGTLIAYSPVTADELVWMNRVREGDPPWLHTSERFGLLNLANLIEDPEAYDGSLFPKWRRLAIYVRLRQAYTVEGGYWPSFLDQLSDESAPYVVAMEIPDDLLALEKLTGWSLSDIAALVRVRNYSPIRLQRVDELWSIAQAMDLARRTRVPLSSDLAGWSKFSHSTAELKAAAKSMRATLEANFDEAQLARLLPEKRDELRVKQRDALIAHYAREFSLVNSEEVVNHMLTDVKMSPCADTTRIKEATLAAQMFVQRILLGLEEEISIPAADKREFEEQWAWMRNYRLWEANRKIFLYPENWLSPELRDDKTELFNDLVDTILADEISDENVERAYRAYLGDLQELASLRVIGMCAERTRFGGSSGSQIHHTTPSYLRDSKLHVFATASETGGTIFHREGVWQRATKSVAWGAWQELPFAVEAKQVVPVVHDGTLHLFWAKVRFVDEGAEPPTSERDAGEASKENAAQIYLGHSYRSSDVWIEPHESNQGILGLAQHPANDTSFRFARDSNILLRVAEGQRKLGSMLSIEAWFHSPRRRSKSSGHLLGGVHIGLAGSFELAHDGFTLSAVEKQSAFGFVVDAAKSVEKDDGLASFSYPIAVGMLGRGQSWIRDLTVERFAPLLTLPWGAEGWKRSSIILSRFSEYKGPVEMVIPVHEGDAYRSDRPAMYQDSTGVFLVMPRYVNRKTSSGSTYAPTIEDGIAGSASGLVEGSLLPYNVATDSTDKPTYAAEDSYGQKPRYQMFPFYHPYVATMRSQLEKHGITGLLAPQAGDAYGGALRRQKIAQALTESDSNILGRRYRRGPGLMAPYPVEQIDFDHGSAFGVYNWELFYHAPIYIADTLMRERKFEEAHRWLHYIFDPTEPEDDALSSAENEARYWKVKPLFEAASKTRRIEDMLADMASGDNDPQLSLAIEQWRENPFRPHLVARTRRNAYQRGVIFKYLDNLLAWADDRFRRFTLETLQEATLIYVYVDQLLGFEPAALPERAVEGKSYAQLRAAGLGDFSNAVSELESRVLNAGRDHWKNEYRARSAEKFKQTVSYGGVTDIHETPAAPVNDRFAGLGAIVPGSAGGIAKTIVSMFGGYQSAATAPYFCVPGNPKFLEYWEYVNDRLTKLRNCLDIDGVARRPPLFAPPIDPGAVASSLAAGGSLGAALDELMAPLPFYRFSTQLRMARELTAEVRALGSALLSAKEKRDAEALARVRAEQESTALEAATAVHEARVTEAEEALHSFEAATKVIEARRDFYESRPRISSAEALGLASSSRQVKLQKGAASPTVSAMQMNRIPGFSFGWTSLGPNATLSFGGSNLAAIFSGFAGLKSSMASVSGIQAQTLNTAGGYERRFEDWQHQAAQAELELERVEADRLAAEKRVETAKVDLERHLVQVENASAYLEQVTSKYTNEELYGWLERETAKVYERMYDLAAEQGRRAERCMKQELGLDEVRFIAGNNWDSSRSAFLAGERLSENLHRMESEYYKLHKREFELTKRVSLARLDPMALEQLRATGECRFATPELLFDLDHPSHYMRRIKTVAVSLPATTGPYTNVGGTLVMERSAVRRKPRANEAAQVDPPSLQSVALSGANEDTGLWNTNLDDPRYLPFEGRGVDGEWSFRLPSEMRQFDYASIEDLVLTIRYSAREGGKLLADAVSKEIQGAWDELVRPSIDVAGENEPGRGRMRAFSLKQEFSDAWQALRHGEGTSRSAVIKLTRGHFGVFDRTAKVSFGSQERTLHALAWFKTTETTEMTLSVATPDSPDAPTTVPISEESPVVSGASYPDYLRYGSELFSEADLSGEAPAREWTLTLTADDVEGLEDLILIVEYQQVNQD